MELHQIRYFLAVARELHFSRAASSCNVTQPALTRAIQKLEEEVGGLLFERRQSGVVLTELGQTLRPRFENAMREVTDARLDAKSLLLTRKRRLRMGLTCTIGPERLIGLIRQLGERIGNLDLSVHEARAREIADMLLRDEIDVAIVGLPSLFPGFRADLLYREQYVIALPPGHRLLERRTVPLACLEGEAYLERLHCEFDDHFASQHGAWPISLNVCFKSEREDWIQSMLAAGLGCAILPEFLPVMAGIETRPLVEPSIFRDVSVVSVEGRTDTAPVSEFITIARAFDWRSPASKKQ